MRVQQRNGAIILNFDRANAKRVLNFRQGSSIGGFSYEFSVSRELYQPASKVSVTINNPSDDTIEAVNLRTIGDTLQPLENRPKILIQGGYDDNLAVVGAGSVYFTRVIHRGNDRKLIIQASTLQPIVRIKKVVINLLNDESLTLRDIIAAITRGVEGLIVNRLPDSLLNAKIGGASFNTTVLNAFKRLNVKLASIEQTQPERGIKPFFVYPGAGGETSGSTLILSPIDKSKKQIRYIFNSSTGLLESPTRENWTFKKFDSKFNPYVDVEDWVTLQSETVNTDGIITKISHNWLDKSALTSISIAPDGTSKAINAIII